MTSISHETLSDGHETGLVITNIIMIFAIVHVCCQTQISGLLLIALGTKCVATHNFGFWGLRNDANLDLPTSGNGVAQGVFIIFIIMTLSGQHCTNVGAQMR